MSNAVEEPTEQTVHDPVCHMDIIATQAAGSTERDGLTYYFCSTACEKAFEADPDRIVEAEKEYIHAG